MKGYFKISNLIEGVSDPGETTTSINFFDAYKDRTPDMEMMLRIHLKMGHLNDYCKAGVLRDYAVYVGGRECLDYMKIEAELEKLFKVKPENWNDVKDWHVKFEGIHPFGDGNGRVGRMLMAVQCFQLGLLDILNEEFLVNADVNIQDIRNEYYPWFKSDEDKLKWFL